MCMFFLTENHLFVVAKALSAAQQAGEPITGDALSSEL